MMGVMRMSSLEQMIRELPPEAQKRRVSLLSTCIRNMQRQNALAPSLREGALAHLRDQYTSVELQHEILKEWEE
jgi:hypothetical protein